MKLGLPETPTSSFLVSFVSTISLALCQYLQYNDQQQEAHKEQKIKVVYRNNKKILDT